MASALLSACASGPTSSEPDGAAPEGSIRGDDRADGPNGFTLPALTQEGIGSENGSGWAHTGEAYADIDWQQGPFAHVLAVLDLESACYPFEQATPPPVGQNWPARCDAFDRNLNVWLDDAPRPAFEIMHAITPFGGPMHLEADVTDLANALPGPHRVRVELGSFADPSGKVTGANAGWTVSMRFDVEAGPAPRRVLAAVPLFARKLLLDDASASAGFSAPAGTVSGRLEYRTSGHGQGEIGDDCFGPAEEFCSRVHELTVDGTVAKSVSAYRRNCVALCSLVHLGPADAGSDYCLENPCGDLKSVRASRANWCPGSMTPPFVWDDIPALAQPGAHTLSVAIAPILAGGHWDASATYFAYGE